MQLVSRKTLQQLISTTSESEDDSKFLFSECLSAYNEFLAEADELDKQKKLKHSDAYANKFADRFDYAYHRLLSSYLKKHKRAFKFVDSGSSRVVFAMPGGKCLKVAWLERGAAQNEQEVKNSQSTYECFPLVYEVDTKSYGMIMVECCAPTYKSDTLNDFSLAYGKGIQLIHVVATLNDIVNVCNCNVDVAYKSLAQSVEQNEYFDGNERDEYGVSYDLRLSICAKIRDDKSPQYEVLRSIIKFYDDHGKNDDSMLLADLEYDKNWGLAIRQNKMVPIIVDSGFSEDVANKHYTS